MSAAFPTSWLSHGLQQHCGWVRVLTTVPARRGLTHCEIISQEWMMLWLFKEYTSPGGSVPGPGEWANGQCEGESEGRRARGSRWQVHLHVNLTLTFLRCPSSVTQCIRFWYLSPALCLYRNSTRALRTHTCHMTSRRISQLSHVHVSCRQWMEPSG